MAIARRMVIEVIDDDMAAVLRQKTGAERLQIANGLLRSARRLIEANIRATHRDWDSARISRAVAERIACGND